MHSLRPRPALPVPTLPAQAAPSAAVRSGDAVLGTCSASVLPAGVMVPAGEVEVAVELHGRMAVITLAGTLDAASSHEVSLALDPLLDAGLALVVIDVGQAEFADTSGIGVLLRAQRLIGGERSLVLRTPRPSLVRLLQLTGLRDEFELA